jgi:excisionase family DNA binding protein
MAPSHPTVEALLTAREVAARWNVALSTVYRMAASGELPSVRFPHDGPIRFDAADVEAFIERGRRPAA